MLLSADLIWSKAGITKHTCSSVEKKKERAKKKKMWDAANKKSRTDRINHNACSTLITLSQID